MPTRCGRGSVNGAPHNARARAREGPICPDALADNIVKLNIRDLEALFNGGIRALAKAGVLATQGDRHRRCHGSGDDGAV